MKFYLTSLFIAITNCIFAQDAVQTLSNSLAADYLKNQSGSLIIGIHDNGREKIYYYGETEKGNHVLPDRFSIYEIGNITETFTSILFAECSIKGVVHIDDKVNDYLPVTIPPQVYQPLVCTPARTEDNRNYTNEDRLGFHFSPYVCLPDPTYKPQPVLLCYLSTHTSGYPELPPGIKLKKANPYSTYSASDLYAYLGNYRLLNPVGLAYKHSETGIALLGLALTNKLKKSYDNLLAENFLDTLEMTDTRINLTDAQKNRYVPGFNTKNKSVGHWSYDAFASAGGLHSTINDMMKFLACNIPLKKNYYSTLLDYTHNSRLKAGGRNNNNLEIGLGWKISPFGTDAKQVVWSSGKTGGFASYIGFVEPNHTGVVILSSVSKDVNALGLELLHLLEKEKLLAE